MQMGMWNIKTGRYVKERSKNGAIEGGSTEPVLSALQCVRKCQCLLEVEW